MSVTSGSPEAHPEVAGEGKPICDMVALPFLYYTMKLQPQKEKSAPYQEWPADCITNNLYIQHNEHPCSSGICRSERSRLDSNKLQVGSVSVPRFFPSPWSISLVGVCCSHDNDRGTRANGKTGLSLRLAQGSTLWFLTLSIGQFKSHGQGQS